MWQKQYGSLYGILVGALFLSACSALDSESTAKGVTPAGIANIASAVNSGSSVLVPASGDSGNLPGNPPGNPPATLQTAASVSQHGVTFYFDKAYPTGQFANGDYYVVPLASGQPVVVQSINPAPEYNPYVQTQQACQPHLTDTDCTAIPAPGYEPVCRTEHRFCAYARVRNGFEINPTPGHGQAFDSRSKDFTINNHPGDLPLSMQTNQSLVATISQPDAKDCHLNDSNPGWTGLFECSPASIKTAVVLTVLATAPAPGTFRPPYAGSQKTLFSTQSLRRELLLNIQPVSGTPSLRNMTRNFSRVALDHLNGWTSDYIHPADNMPGYGAGLSRLSGEATLLLNIQATPENKEPLLIAYVQRGIDNFGILKNGGAWPSDGGEGSGRKWPILFAGILLNDTDMQGIGFNYNASRFGEDGQTYYDDLSIYSTAAWPNYTGIPGFPLWGIRHFEDPSIPGNNDESSPYRLCCTSESWTGEALAARLMHAEVLWNHQAYFDYKDRHEQEGQNGYWESQFNATMWDQYRPTIDTCHNGVQDRCSVNCNRAGGILDGETAVDQGGGC